MRTVKRPSTCRRRRSRPCPCLPAAGRGVPTDAVSVTTAVGRWWNASLGPLRSKRLHGPVTPATRSTWRCSTTRYSSSSSSSASTRGPPCRDVASRVGPQLGAVVGQQPHVRLQPSLPVPGVDPPILVPHLEAAEASPHCSPVEGIGELYLERWGVGPKVPIDQRWARKAVPRHRRAARSAPGPDAIGPGRSVTGFSCARRLVASPRFSSRWGRRRLVLVRFRLPCAGRRRSPRRG